jgi:hypothetical protein
MSDLKKLEAECLKVMKDGEFFWRVRPTRSKLSPLQQPVDGPVFEWSGQIGSTNNSNIRILVGPSLSEEGFLRDAIKEMRLIDKGDVS